MMNGIMGEWHFNNYTNTWKIDYSKLVYSRTFRHDFTYKMGTKSKDIFENSQLLMELNMDGEASLNPTPSFNDGYNPQVYLTGGDDPIKPKAKSDGAKTSSFFGVSLHTDPNRSVGYTVPPVGIFIGKDNLYWKMHEYGHYLQYQQMGGGAIGIIPFYLFVGLPSAINQVTGLGGIHDTFVTETDANARAYLYFKNFYDNKTMTNFLNLYPLFPVKK